MLAHTCPLLWVFGNYCGAFAGTHIKSQLSKVAYLSEFEYSGKIDIDFKIIRDVVMENLE